MGSLLQVGGGWRQRELAGLGLVVLSAAGFATTGPIARFAAAEGIETLPLVVWRGTLAVVPLAAFLAARLAAGHPLRIPTAPRRQRSMTVAASVAIAALNLGLFSAFLRISIGMTLLLFFLYPAFVVTVGKFVFGEPVSRHRATALLISFVGAGLIVTGAGISGELDIAGVLLALTAAVAQTAFIILARHGFQEIPDVEATIMTQSGALIIYLAVSTITMPLTDLAEPLAAPNGMILMVLAGTIGAAVPSLALLGAVRRLGPGRASILATLQPVMGILLAALLLGEYPSLIQIIGGSLVLAAAALLQLERPPSLLARHDGPPAIPRREG